MSRLDRVSWPARRYLCDLLVGRHAYSRNVAPWFEVTGRTFSGTWGPGVRFKNCEFNDVSLPFDQERAS